MKIGVIYGGVSSEREISLLSGEAVYKALIENGHEVFKTDPLTDDIIDVLRSKKPDIAFIALHGKMGEDGTVQGLLEYLKIPYTGNTVLGSAVTMNKIFTQSILKEGGYPVPKFITLTKDEYKEIGASALYKIIEEKLNGIPIVVKAPSQGSSIGIYFIDSDSTDLIGDLDKNVKKAFEYENRIMIEELLAPSTETPVSVIGNKNPISMPTLELVFKEKYNDYETKYTPGACTHIIPSSLPKKIRDKCRYYAVEIYKLLELKGFARIDFMVYEDEAYVIDVNTIPGMTSLSYLPDVAKYIGIDFNMLMNIMIDLAIGKEFDFEPFMNRLADV